MDNIRRLIEEGNYVLSLYIYLSKAFDTVDHQNSFIQIILL